MPKSLYMHTINGSPAFFEGREEIGGGQVVFANKFTPVERLETSLRAIKQNIQATKKFREGRGWDFDGKKYGYIRIKKSALPQEKE